MREEKKKAFIEVISAQKAFNYDEIRGAAFAHQ